MEDTTKIPTAEEFCRYYKVDEDGNIVKANEFKSSYDMMTEYANIKAKFYVQEALKAAAENAKIETMTWDSPHSSEWTKVIDKQSILTAYPLTNIK